MPAGCQKPKRYSNIPIWIHTSAYLVYLWTCLHFSRLNQHWTAAARLKKADMSVSKMLMSHHLVLLCGLFKGSEC